MKNIALLILFSLIKSLLNTEAETDSVKVTMKMAKTDVKRFVADDNIWKGVRKHKIMYTSDYFKPTAFYTNNTKMLADSNYVKAFRGDAFKKTLHRRTAGHYILIGGIILFAVYIAIAAATAAAINSASG